MQIETERTIIRRFQSGDWKDLQEIAISNENSGFADCDHAWPLDEDGIKGACSYFAGDSQYWAVEAKALKKVVCFVSFNYIDENQSLDIGHVSNNVFFFEEYDYEALKALFYYAFLELGAESIHAGWALADEKKLAPLRKLGMKVVETMAADKFRPGPDGKIGTFEGCKLAIDKAQWMQKPVL
ncbi:MAG: GNAT family N-acetyltransferase [Eubacteriaceae bacterium]|nr:GNAT family N-acetyltransferase [Eubacteriaceae bacterium]